MYNVKNKGNIDWTATGDDRVLQNVKNLLSIYRYDIPNDRVRGLDPKLIDNPVSNIDEIKIDILDVISTYEPSVSIIDINVIPLVDGDLEIEVSLTID